MTIFSRIVSRIFSWGGGRAARPVGGGSPGAPTTPSWCLRIATGAVLAALFLTPLTFLPFTQDALFVKFTVAALAAVVAAAAWLLDVLVAKRFTYRRSPLNATFLVLTIVLIASTLGASARWASFWGSDPSGERTATLLSFVVLAFVAAAVFERRDVARALSAILSSLVLLAAFTLLSIGAAATMGQVPAWLNVNPVGTVNALALVFAVGFLVALGVSFAQVTSAGRRTIPVAVGRLATCAAAVLAAALLLTGFGFLWLGLALALLLVLALNFMKSWQREDGAAEYALPNAAVAIGIAVVAGATFLAFRTPQTLTRLYERPAELSPSLRATLAMDRQALADHPLLGSGPGSFRNAYNQFRDPALNDTVFWATRFNHGFSFLTTLPATVGALGTLAFLGFAVSALTLIIRSFLGVQASDPYRWAIGGATVFLLVMWALYASNFTASLLLFILLGLFTVVAQREPEGERRSWWRIVRRSFVVEAPMLNFVVSLAVVFGAALALVAAYSLLTQYAGEVAFLRAARALNTYGNVDTARVSLERAIGLNSTEDGYHQGRAQVALVAVQQIISRAAVSPGEDLAGQFRNEYAAGVAAAQRATELAPLHPQHWFLLGQLYEVVIPFGVVNADSAAHAAYQQALGVDPLNPVFPLAQGRVYLTVADLLSQQIGQTRSGEERSQLEARRAEALKSGREVLEQAIRLKRDFADAHFLFAQNYVREGNVPDAIRKTEDAARLAPNDIGVLFQLGVLYYQSGNLDGARPAFERALLLNENYSNARYFLGLIWDQKGDADGAISQFQKIAALNPGNEEVERIIANLRGGRPALTGIVPPAPPPEARTEPPVRETEGRPPSRRELETTGGSLERR